MTRSLERSQSSEPNHRRSALALFGLALVPRLYVALAWAREPVWDGHYYDIGARSIAAGRGYAGVEGGPWCHYPVGYSAWLGLGYKLLGASGWVGPILNALCGALTASLVYLLALRLVEERGSRRAFAAGALVALNPGLIAYTPLLMTETTSAALVVLAPVVFLWRGAGWQRAVSAGLVLGAATLVRPQSLLLAPAVVLLMAPGVGRKMRLALAALTTATTLLLVAPWSARNCVVMDGCALVSTNGGWNLAIGAFPRATGRFETLRGSDGCDVVTGQVQQDRCWSQKAVGWIRSDPWRWLSLMPKKLSHTFDHESFAVGYLGEADPVRWTDQRKETARRFLSAVHRALLVLATLAFVRRPSRSRPRSLLANTAILLLVWIGVVTDEHPFWPLALALVAAASVEAWRRSTRAGPALYAAYAIATLVVVHAVFFGEDRYHLVVTPLLCLLAAFAWWRPADDSDHPVGLTAHGLRETVEAREEPLDVPLA